MSVPRIVACETRGFRVDGTRIPKSRDAESAESEPRDADHAHSKSRDADRAAGVPFDRFRRGQRGAIDALEDPIKIALPDPPVDRVPADAEPASALLLAPCS
jgi:hypothetical protein